MDSCVPEAYASAWKHSAGIRDIGHWCGFKIMEDHRRVTALGMAAIDGSMEHPGSLGLLPKCPKFQGSHRPRESGGGHQELVDVTCLASWRQRQRCQFQPYHTYLGNTRQQVTNSVRPGTLNQKPREW